MKRIIICLLAFALILPAFGDNKQKKPVNLMDELVKLCQKIDSLNSEWVSLSGKKEKLLKEKESLEKAMPHVTPKSKEDPDDDGKSTRQKAKPEPTEEKKHKKTIDDEIGNIE